MPPKKKGGKKKAPEIVEPEHDPTWQRAIISGVWDRPVSALPDANTWPSWGALREQVLAATREIRVGSSPSVHDAFASELVKLSPPLLKSIDFSACHNVHTFVLSPQGSCPCLEALDLSNCPGLEYVLIQSNSLKAIDLKACALLSKALLHCPNLERLSITGCSKLETLMLWTERLTELDMTGATAVSKLELQCLSLDAARSKLPNVQMAPVAVKPVHPPIAVMLRENARDAALAAAEDKDKEWRASSKPRSGTVQVYRMMN
eukprot:gene11065-11221_t